MYLFISCAIKCIFDNLGGGPSCLPEKYHTVLELPESRCNVNKRRSPLKWKSFFTPISLGTSPRWKKSEPNLKPSINMVSIVLIFLRVKQI